MQRAILRSRRCRRAHARAMRLEMWGANRKSELLAKPRRRAGGDRRAGRTRAVVGRDRSGRDRVESFRDMSTAPHDFGSAKRHRQSSMSRGCSATSACWRFNDNSLAAVSRPRPAGCPASLLAADGSRNMPHELRCSTSCDARDGAARDTTLPRAVGTELPRLAVVLEIDAEERAQPLVQRRTLDRRNGLDATVEIARHPVGGADVELFGAAVREVPETRMLEEAADDADRRGSARSCPEVRGAGSRCRARSGRSRRRPATRDTARR